MKETFQSRVLNNLASCYARMFQYEKAFGAYERAYTRDSQPDILKRLYSLSRMDGRLKLGDRFQVWEGEMEDAKEKAAQADSLRQLDELFKRDPIKRQAGEAQLLRRLKQEYRTMV